MRTHEGLEVRLHAFLKLVKYMGSWGHPKARTDAMKNRRHSSAAGDRSVALTLTPAFLSRLQRSGF
jgi:hypothetical protein